MANITVSKKVYSEVLILIKAREDYQKLEEDLQQKREELDKLEDRLISKLESSNIPKTTTVYIQELNKNLSYTSHHVSTYDGVADTLVCEED